MKEEIKRSLIGIGTFFAFGLVSSLALDFLFVGDEEFPLMFLHCALQLVALAGYIFLLQLKDLVLLIYYLITLPLRLLRRKKSKQEEQEVTPDTDGRSVIYFSLLLFSLAGWLMNKYFESSLWLVVYPVLGLLWGYTVYRFFKKGIIDLDEERNGM